MILMITLLIICYNNNILKKKYESEIFRKGFLKNLKEPRRVKEITNIKANDRVSFENKQ